MRPSDSLMRHALTFLFACLVYHFDQISALQETILCKGIRTSEADLKLPITFGLIRAIFVTYIFVINISTFVIEWWRNIKLNQVTHSNQASTKLLFYFLFFLFWGQRLSVQSKISFMANRRTSSTILDEGKVIDLFEINVFALIT